MTQLEVKLYLELMKEFGVNTLEVGDLKIHVSEWPNKYNELTEKPALLTEDQLKDQLEKDLFYST